jgi:tetratricopeptide (TPR) repeat protein
MRDRPQPIQREGASPCPPVLRRSFVQVLLLLFLIASAQPLLAADPAQTYAEGIEKLYSLDFAASEAAFKALTREHPDNPDYWNALASSYWLKTLYDQQKLNMESFSGKDRFGTTDSRDTVSEAEEKQLRDTIDKAMGAADAILKKDPKNTRALYAKGASLATLASFEATIRRSWLSAARKAKTARNFHKDVLKMDPNFHDARTTVGIYNYAVGSLSWGARMLVSVVGLGGDGKQNGIKDIETAAAKGVRSAIDAKMLLIVVYGREQQYDKALKVLDEVHDKYPRNFMLEMSKGSIYAKMKRWELAAQTYRQIADKVHAHKDGYDRMRVEKVLYELANAEFQALKFDDATKTFGLVTNGATATPSEKANAHLWMGRMSDSRKNRADALRHYHAVLKLEVGPEIKSDAERLIKKPFGSP